MWFLFQEIFDFMENNFNPQPDYPLFQSKIKGFSLSRVQVLFCGDEMSEFFMQ